MRSERNRVYLQHPWQEGNLLPAQLLKEDDGVLSVRLFEELMLPPTTETRQFFHDKNELFYGFSCEVLRTESGGTNPIISVIQTGEQERHEHRETFRLGVYDDAVTATIDGQYNADVFDIGYSGVSLVTDPGSYIIDAWVNIELRFDCKTVSGRVQVRNRKQHRDGRYRYGMMADPTDMEFLKALAAITQTLQSIKAKRASRVTGKNQSFDRLNAEQAEQAEEPDNKEQKELLAEIAIIDGDQSRRRFARKPWVGPARVFVLEQRQLRVLEVDTKDLSQGGLSFASRSYIYEGAEILFEKPMSGGIFRVCASVRNVYMCGNGVHRVGVEFVSAPLKAGEAPARFSSAI